MAALDPYLLLAIVLTLGTGAVDALSYFSLDHVFTANMSGNIALLGIGVVTDPRTVAGNACAFAGFVGGSLLAGRAIRTLRDSRPRVVASGLLAELAVMAVVVALMAFTRPTADSVARAVVCVVLALAMGLQTGLARYIAIPDVNTTVATMTLHGLAADSRLAGGDSARWRRRASVVGALFAGAAAGVALDEVVPWGGAALATALVALAAWGAVLLARRETAVAMATA
jgi:uncharacterized membrane protein YoaK (UPF0700 family)